MGRICRCGFDLSTRSKSRPVIQADGSISHLGGDIYRPRKQANGDLMEKAWKSMYYRARNSSMTFRQAEACFAKEHGWVYPDRSLPLMPKEANDFFLRVADVPFERLRR
jgi:hypothetical protein